MISRRYNMREQFDDNDITIADMNVEGMPW
jgi:hypothetical protein